jgi:MFS family permease
MEWTFALLTLERVGWSEAAGGARLNGYVFGLVGVIAAITQGALMGRLTRRFGERTLVRAGLAILVVGFVGLAAVNSVALLVAASAAIALGNSLCTPALSALVSRATPADLQGSVLGVLQSLGALARVFGPACGGLLFDHLGSPWPFLVGAGALAAALVVALVGVAPAPRPEGAGT